VVSATVHVIHTIDAFHTTSPQWQLPAGACFDGGLAL